MSVKSYTAAMNEIAELKSAKDKVSTELEHITADYNAAVKLIVEHVEKGGLGRLESANLSAPGCEINIGKKAESNVVKNTTTAAQMLEDVEKGLAYKLAKFSITDLRKYLSPIDLKKIFKTTFGSRRVTVKLVR
ncbi:MAG: hypothetical protein PVI43_00340 [Candidatus Bathyarchaeota archaeon]|jgi:hypothetical protein